jgi:hypothetical protein
MDEMVADIGREYEIGSGEQGEPLEVQNFYRLLTAIDEKVHDGTDVTVLQAVTRLTTMKSKYNFLNQYTNMEEVIPYFEKFDKIYWKQSEQPTLEQLDHMHEHGIQDGPSFTKWFRTHVIYLLLFFLS